MSHISCIQPKLVNEKKTRKNWLISFFLMSLISVISLSLRFFGEVGIEEIETKTNLIIILFLCLFLSALFMTPWFWITYHCSYIKRGTRWLIWTLIIIPLRELNAYLDAYKEGLNFIEWTALEWLALSVFLGVEVYYWINCLSLYRDNSVFKLMHAKANFENSDEYATCITKMESSLNSDDLDCIFYYAIGKWPQWEKQLSKVYNERKVCLFETN